MTKADEIVLLDKTIAKFGPHSYLGPWLTEFRGQLVGDINNDLPASAPLPSAARAEGRLIVDAATREAADILATAKRQAAGTLQIAQKRESDLRAELVRDLDRALQAVRLPSYGGTVDYTTGYARV